MGVYINLIVSFCGYSDLSKHAVVFLRDEREVSHDIMSCSGISDIIISHPSIGKDDLPRYEEGGDRFYHYENRRLLRVMAGLRPKSDAGGECIFDMFDHFDTGMERPFFQKSEMRWRMRSE